MCDRTCKMSAQVTSATSAFSRKVEPNDQVSVAPQAAQHYWRKLFPIKIKLISLFCSHCQGWLERQSGFLQPFFFFFACHSCFMPLWKERKATRSRSKSLTKLLKANERKKKSLHRRKGTFTSDWQHKELFIKWISKLKKKATKKPH